MKRTALEWLPEAAVVLFAFLWNYPCGILHFDLQDSSVAFDGAYRVFLGQLPMRDFYTPVGPPLFLWQGLVFKLFGISYWAHVTGASIVNAVIAICAMGIGRRLTADRRLILAAGVLSALFNSPIHHGAPWYETMGFLFLFISLWLLTRGEDKSAILAGAAAALAFYSKQTVGAIGVCFFGLWLLQTWRIRLLLAYAGGFAAGLVGFFALWSGFAPWRDILRYLFILPLTAGRSHIALSPLPVSIGLGLGLAALLLFTRKEWMLWLTTCLLMVWALGSRITYVYFFVPLLILLALEKEEDRALLAALIFIQIGLRMPSWAETYIFAGMIGLIFLLFAKGFASSWPAWRGRLERIGAEGMPSAGVIWTAFGILVYAGVRVSLLRKVSSIQIISLFGSIAVVLGLVFAVLLLRAMASATRAPKPAFSMRLSAAALLVCIVLTGLGCYQTAYVYGVKCAQGWTKLGWIAYRSVRVPGMNGLMEEPDKARVMEEAYAYLSSLPAEKRPFFVYPNATIFHAALREVPPQPFLWFDPGLSYRTGEPDETRLCGSLRKNRVATIAVHSSDPERELAAIPCLDEMVRSEFAQVHETEGFRFYQRRHPPPARP
ncbi:MAG: glycosyltransferase family 39 protein [Elusimicrobiota bacterium]